MKTLLLTTLLVSAVTLLQGCAETIAVGVGAGVIASEDRRTTGTYIEDEGIELKTGNRVSERFRDQVHVNATSYNRVVLLTGETPSEQIRSEVEKIARSVENVRNVVNELAIAAPSSYTSRSGDALLTAKVKARFVDAGKFNVLHVKVVSENGVVYLLGMVKRKEADDAVEIARTTGGVQKVVKVFEYLD